MTGNRNIFKMTPMYNEYLAILYQNHSKLEILLIANNSDGSYTDDAIETAKHILITKYNENEEPKILLQMELERLFELDKYCSLCHKDPDIVYSEGIKFCSDEKISVVKAIPSYLLLGVIGVQLFGKKYKFVTVIFKLCSSCLSARIDIKDRNAKPKIEWQEYYLHPLYKHYQSLGFGEIRKIE